MVLVKFCRWDGKRCYCSSCDFITLMGDVLVCSRHGNPHGRFIRHVPVVVGNLRRVWK